MADYSINLTGNTINLELVTSTINLEIATSGPQGATGPAGTLSNNSGATISGDLSVTGTTTTNNIVANGTTTLSGFTSNSNSSINGDFTVNTNDFYVDSVNSCVGIGTSSPNLSSSPIALTVGGSSESSFEVQGSRAGTDGNVGGLRYYNGSNQLAAIIARRTGADNSGSILAYTASAGVLSEAVRLDSSGNLLVGKTAADNTTVGTTIYGGNSASMSIVRSDASQLILNRLSTDGDMAVFRKDGTTVGSIGTRNGASLEVESPENVEFKSSAGGTERTIYFGSSHFSPFLAYDSSVDIGMSNRKWKDLYLSGGVYLGGTGSANYLDDYEEGTWTPTYTTTGTPFSSVTYNSYTGGTYTKIGNTVIIRGHVSTEAINVGSATGTVLIGNLPFTSSSGDTDVWSYGSCSGHYFAANPPVSVKLANNSTGVFLQALNPYGESSSLKNVNISDLATGATSNIVTFTLAYTTDS